MRAVKAKKLRVLARAATVGQPAVAYDAITTHVGGYLDADKKVPFYIVNPIRLAKGCTRDVYQRWKRIGLVQHT